MRPTLARRTAYAVLPTLALLVLAGCGGESGAGADQGAPSTTTSIAPILPAGTPAPSGPNTKSPSSTTDPSGEQADVRLDVTVANGKVSPNGRSVEVKAGQSVLITAISDAPDQLHVHGYDKEVDLQPGRAASVTFVADQKGTFEVETHESAKLIAKLVVS